VVRRRRCLRRLLPRDRRPCCHGDDEVEVYRQLCEIVAEWVEIARQDGKPLPAPTAGRVALLAEPA